MKTLLTCLLVSAWASPILAQTVGPIIPGQPIVADSAGRNVSPAIRPMGTGFYRRPGDSPDVMRATLDNMPIKTPRPDQEYSILNPHLRSPYRYNPPYQPYNSLPPEGSRWHYRRQR